MAYSYCVIVAKDGIHEATHVMVGDNAPAVVTSAEHKFAEIVREHFGVVSDEQITAALEGGFYPVEDTTSVSGVVIYISEPITHAVAPDGDPSSSGGAFCPRCGGKNIVIDNGDCSGFIVDDVDHEMEVADATQCVCRDCNMSFFIEDRHANLLQSLKEDHSG